MTILSKIIKRQNIKWLIRYNNRQIYKIVKTMMWQESEGRSQENAKVVGIHHSQEVNRLLKELE